MLLDQVAQPSLMPDPIYSFYPYPVLARTKVHATLLRSVPSPTATSSAASTARNHPGPSAERHAQSRNAIDRAARRALMGRRPAGVALGREAEELSDEEAALEDESRNTNMFGHRFLLPFGRRHTQMEMDAAPSPTPSEPDHERRQEDRNMGSPGVVGVEGEGEEPAQMVEEEGEVDLDASVEDLDAEANGEGGGSEEEGEEAMEE